MPRALGQIDAAKSEAILDAAVALFAERGLGASMAEIARAAGVSKQTLYNRYPSKTAIAEAIAHRRSDAITQPLKTDGPPAAVLEAFALALLDGVCSPGKGATLRGVALATVEAPELGRAVYDAGPGESLSRLAAWLTDQNTAGRLSIGDPRQAAEMFTGMVLGHAHVRTLLGVPHISPEACAGRAREATARFLRAFAV